MGEKLQFTELDQYLFGQGTHYDVYRKLGAHPVKQGKKVRNLVEFILQSGDLDNRIIHEKK